MSQFKLGMLLSYATSALSLLLGLIYTPWMISVIGSDDYGLYTLAISVINLFLLDFGLGTAISRFLSNYCEKEQFEKASGFLSTAYAVYTGISAIVAVALAVIYFNIDAIYISLGKGQIELFKKLYLVVAFYSVVSLPFLSQNSVLLAEEKYVALKGCILAQKLFTILLTVLGLIAGYGVFSLVTVNAIANLLFTLIRQIIIRRCARIKLKSSEINVQDAKDLLSFSGWVFVSQMASRCNWSLIPSLLGVFSGSFQIALFGLASQLESYVYALADAVNGILMPKVTNALNSPNSSLELTNLMIRIGRFQLIVVGFIVACFIGAGHHFIDLWLGTGYDSLWICVVIVISPHILLLPQSTGSVALTASGRVRHVALASGLMVLVSICLGVTLIPAHGALGGCLAVGMSVLVYLLVINYLFVNLLDVDLFQFYKRVYARWIFVFTPTTLAGFIASSCFSVSWSSLILICMGLAVFYGVGSWLLLLNSDEKQAIICLLPHKH